MTDSMDVEGTVSYCDSINISQPIMIKAPKGDIKITRLNQGEKILPDIRLGKVRVPGMNYLKIAVTYPS